MYQSLLEITGVERAPRQTLATHYRDILFAISELSDEAFDALPEDARAWANAGTRSLKSPDEAGPVPMMPEHAQPVEPVKPVEPAKPRRRKPQARAADSSADAIRRLLLEYPEATVTGLLELLTERGIVSTRSSVQTLHHHFRAAIRALHESGLVTDAAAFDEFASRLTGPR